MQIIDPVEAGTISTRRPDRLRRRASTPVPAAEITTSPRDELEATAEPARDGGPRRSSSPAASSTEESETSAESTGMLIGFVVLAITLGSLLAAGMPLLTAVIGVGIGHHRRSPRSPASSRSPRPPRPWRRCSASRSGSTTRCSSSRATARTSRTGYEPREAAALAIATAGSAVVFAGATVVIALVGLLVVNIPFLTVMGLAAAGTVAIAVLIALTLLPALLGFAGERMRRVNRVLGQRRRAQPREGHDAGRPLGRASSPGSRSRSSPSASSACVAIAVPGPRHEARPARTAARSPRATPSARPTTCSPRASAPASTGPLTGVVDAPELNGDERKQLGEQITAGVSRVPGRRRGQPADRRTRPVT